MCVCVCACSRVCICYITYYADLQVSIENNCRHSASLLCEKKTPTFILMDPYMYIFMTAQT